MLYSCLFCVLLLLAQSNGIAAQDPTTGPPTDPATNPPTLAPTNPPTDAPTDPPVTDPPTTTVPPTTTLPSVDINENSYKWSPGKDLPGGYPAGSSETKMFQVDEGYSIAVTIENLDLDGDSQDHLVIRSGTVLNDLSTDGRIFTYMIKDPLKLLYKSSSVIARFEVKGTNAGKHTGFTVTFERAGELSTGEPTDTTTDVSWPTTVEGDSTYYTVNVSTVGKTAVDDALTRGFKTSVAKMAVMYCKDEDIVLTEEITNANVKISEMIACPYSWPDSEKCLQITFRLPVFHDESKWKGYQLNTHHLEIMWKRYSDRFLDHDHLQISSEPDVGNVVMWWAIAISVVTVAFIIILGLLRFSSVRLRNMLRERRRRLSDTTSIVSSKKDSILSMAPHYLQDVPKFGTFENEYTIVESMD